MMDRLTDANYVRDALRERLPSGWSLARAQVDPETARYRWTRWATAQEVVVEVHEGYLASVEDVDMLCNQLTEAVYNATSQVQYRHLDTSPISPERLKSGAQ